MKDRADWIDPSQPLSFVPAATAACTHLDHVQPVHPGTAGCATCLAEGKPWVQIRVCMTCGHVGCCDSTPGQHANKHFLETGHAVMRSIEPNATWGWCYVDRVMLYPATPA